MSVEKYGWAIRKSLFAQTNQGSTISHTRQNSKMFNKTSKEKSFLIINYLQAEQRIQQGIFLRAIPVCIIVP